MLSSRSADCLGHWVTGACTVLMKDHRILKQAIH